MAMVRVRVRVPVPVRFGARVGREVSNLMGLGLA